MTNILKKIYKFVPKRFQKRLLSIIVKREGGQMYSAFIREVYKKEYGIEIGYGSYGGCFSLKNVPRGVKFGNYCSIAADVRIFRANHPKGTFTSHPLLYNPIAGYVKSDQLDRPTLEVGHDVWIGEWAVVLPSVKKIGNGAMIGAGSIVTKDVEPYTVVAGNPAKIIGRRFNDEIVSKLEESKWWTLDRDKLVQEIDFVSSLVDNKIENEQ